MCFMTARFEYKPLFGSLLFSCCSVSVIWHKMKKMKKIWQKTCVEVVSQKTNKFLQKCHDNENERGQNTHGQGERVKIPLLSNNVGKKSAIDAGLQQGHDTTHSHLHPVLDWPEA